MNKLLHHLHSSIQLIQRQNVLLSKEPQPRALPKVLSKKERLGEDGERSSKLGFQKKPPQTQLNSHCCYADKLQEKSISAHWNNVLPTNNDSISNLFFPLYPLWKQTSVKWNKQLKTKISHLHLYLFRTFHLTLRFWNTFFVWRFCFHS